MPSFDIRRSYFEFKIGNTKTPNFTDDTMVKISYKLVNCKYSTWDRKTKIRYSIIDYTGAVSKPRVIDIEWSNDIHTYFVDYLESMDEKNIPYENYKIKCQCEPCYLYGDE